jgi:hypothetical protein
MPRRRSARHDGPSPGDPARMPRRGHGGRTWPLVVGWPAVRRVPAVLVQICDVRGAGDTVLATLGVVMATGGTIVSGCCQAVLMAAEHVFQMGAKPADRLSLPGFFCCRVTSLVTGLASIFMYGINWLVCLGDNHPFWRCERSGKGENLARTFDAGHDALVR